MEKLNRAIDRFCLLHPRFGLPNLMLYVVVGNIAVFVLDMFSRGSGLSELLYFSTATVARGQFWRLLTFVFIPESSGILLLVSCYFYYWIGSSLEKQWGTAKFTCYYIGGMFFTLLGASIVSLLTGYSIQVHGASYVNFAMFMAFAMLWPDAQVLLFFIIPVRIRYLAYLDAGLFALSIIGYIARGRWFYAILPVMALLNFVIFFWPELLRFLKVERVVVQSRASRFRGAASDRRAAQSRSAETQRRTNNARQQASGGLRKCAVCGRTNETNPELDFRYCSRCAGYHCFCSDHIFSHVHFTEDQP